MNNTTIAKETNQILFVNKEHRDFYYKNLCKAMYKDVYHQALFYCLGINEDTRKRINRIYDFTTRCIKPECLYEGWQTSGSLRVVRLAFNLFTNWTPSIYEDAEKKLEECEKYTPADLFACSYAPFFWQAVKIRYPEYTS